ncbi:hypothetical protein M413DRAFT_443171 [Hebeloma cylindrosporum]|uniref:Uncharacterized protein n=1 Tax=Hebeloma cylindrosporum TaxID=76867 RepID=A0A0C2Y2U2_HEBCY|nr:hypothetical protein M413DRAFT_443171 [Hebeloma cylindrosporum h7]
MSHSDDPCITPPSPPPPEYESVIDKLGSSSFALKELMRPPSDEPQEQGKDDIANDQMLPGPPPKLASNLSDDIPAPPSTFSDKLNTNYVPGDTEIAEIKQYVSSVHHKLTQYDARIAELEAALQEITKKRTELHTIVSAHEALISPLRRLPPEILQLIFVWCLPQNHNSVMHASEAPVLLGRVCSEWRRISLATPEVWASLHIVPPNVNFSNPGSSAARFERKRELVKMWLERSGACPLSISLVWFAGDSEEEVKLCASILEVLVPMCGRWKTLDFQVPLKMFTPFIGLTVEDVPLLEGMSLMDNRTPLDTVAVDRWPESLTFAESATKLRNFTLTFFSGGIRLPSIPWPQLTTLYLESNIAFFFTDSREMLNTLSGCANLQSCTLKFPLSHTALLPAYKKLDAPIVLPQLLTLCVDGDQHLHNTFHMSNTLTNLCAPKLRKLEILGRSGRPEGSVAPEPLGAVRTLLQRSKCPLERLNVESMTMLPDEFVACLRLIPSLVELVVHNWSVRVITGTPAEEDTAAVNTSEVAEDLILRALTVGLKEAEVVREDDETLKGNEDDEKSRLQVEPIAELPDAQSDSSTTATTSESPANVRSSTPPAEASTSTILSVSPMPSEPLCPNLQRFDFTLCDASQHLFCDFVSSRWENLPRGVSRIKSVKCNFAAFEDDAVKARMQKFRAEGLDAFVTYQVPMNDDLNPSPWTGLEGPP